MIVTAVSVKDFKGLKSVKIRPDPTLVIVTGRNAQGKSSLLDALESAIGGKQAAPARPIRNGEEKAEVRVTLGDISVTRRWSHGSESKLYVENADGSRPRSPQTLLNTLYSRVAVDPGEFVRWESRKQAEVLRKVAGIDADLAALDADAERLRSERQEVTRAVKSDEGALANYPPEGELAGVPDEEPSLDAITERFNAAVREKAENSKIRDGLEKEHRAFLNANSDLDKQLAEIHTLETKLAEANSRAEQTRQELTRISEDMQETRAVCDALVDPDTDSILAEIRAADSVAKRVRAKRARQEVYDRWLQNREHSAGLTSQIEAIQAEKEARLSEARFPIDGLDVRGDEVRLNGVPLDQASSAQKIRLGLAVGAALNPSLRVALIRDGSLLDDAAMEEVEKWSSENHWQTWVERVGSTNSHTGIIIEDGNVYADRSPGRKKEVSAWDETKKDAESLF